MALSVCTKKVLETVANETAEHGGSAIPAVCGEKSSATWDAEWPKPQTERMGSH